MKVIFTVEEIGAARMCSSKEKGGMISELLDFMCKTDDNAMVELLANTINKLDVATEEEFAELLTYPVADFDENAIIAKANYGAEITKANDAVQSLRLQKYADRLGYKVDGLIQKLGKRGTK